MTDFVTRLEGELHAAALRHEGAGAVRRVALPRMRSGLRALPAAAAAAALLAVALMGIGIVLSSSPERTAHLGVPPVLRGTWQAPPTELRFYTAGSKRCVSLGIGSSVPCYTLGASATGVASEWGLLSVSDDELALGAMQDSRPGVYRWRIEGGALRLAKVRDPVSSRARALVTTPLERRHPASGRHRPYDWLDCAFTSRRFGYSIRLPHPWLRESTRTVDRFCSSSTSVTMTAQGGRPGLSGARWGVIVDARSEGDGCVPPPAIASWWMASSSGSRSTWTAAGRCGRRRASCTPAAATPSPGADPRPDPSATVPASGRCWNRSSSCASRPAPRRPSRRRAVGVLGSTWSGPSRRPGPAVTCVPRVSARAPRGVRPRCSAGAPAGRPP